MVLCILCNVILLLICIIICNVDYHSIECDLEGRFSRIRTGETNLGNLVTDIMRTSTRSEIALLNSGTFRSDAVHSAGPFRVKVSNTPVQ